MGSADLARRLRVWVAREVFVPNEDRWTGAGSGAPAMPSGSPQGQGILCRVGTRLCILPLSCVVETMRPQPVEAVVGAPSFVCGLAVIRGLPTPVVDARRLLGADEQSPPTRFVTLKVGARFVALAVDAVIGIRPLAGLTTDELPPLLDQADGPASAVGAVDRELLQVLQGARLIPAAVWAVLEQQQVPS